MLFGEREVEEAEDDAVDREVEFGGASAVGADLAVEGRERVAELTQRTSRCGTAPLRGRSARMRGLPILVLFLRNRSHSSSQAADSQADSSIPGSGYDGYTRATRSHGIWPGPFPKSGDATPFANANGWRLLFRNAC